MRRAGEGFLLRAGAFAVGLAVILAGAVGRAQDAPDKKAPTDEQLKEQVLAFNAAKSDAAQRTALREFIKDRAAAKRAITIAAKLQKDAKGKDRPFTFTGAMVAGRAAIIVREYDAAEVFYEFCAEAATKLDSGEKIVNAYGGLVDTYFAARRYDDVVDVCQRVIEMNGPPEVERFRVYFLEQLVKARALQGNTREALRITESLLQRDDDAWDLLELRGWVQRQAGKHKDAIASYREAIEKMGADRRLRGEARDKQIDRAKYLLSSVYVDADDIDSASKELLDLIKRHPDNPTYKNDLGYIWADRGLKLDEAEKMIREALDLDKARQEKAVADGLIDEVKENSAYLDSLGWVLFKKKDYAAALPYLKKAAADEDEGDHLELWDHLGDCHLALGDKAAAIATWQKGLTFPDISRRDEPRRRRVEAKLREQGVEPMATPKKDAPPMRKID